MRALLIASLFAVACSDPPKEPPPPPPKPAAAPVAAKPAVPAGPAPMTRESVLADARKRVLEKDDFTESDTNRDPFRSFLNSFVVATQIRPHHPIVLEKFAIEELRLAGIVTGELQPRAMFIDPGGQGVTVNRGDHMSKTDALVTRIAPDRVYLRIEEDLGGGKSRVTERSIELHAGELSPQ